MMRQVCWLVAWAVVSACGLVPATAADVSITKTDTELEFAIGGKPVARYQYAGTVQMGKGEGTKPLAKPFFYPLLTLDGTPVTRSWPIKRGTPGDTTDHFHQKSAWFCHGDVIPEGITLKTKSADKRVKGVDFWAETAGHGRIVCDQVKVESGTNFAETHNVWQTPDGVPILDESRTIMLVPSKSGYFLVLAIDLHAKYCPITFGDTKEGAMGVRVNDQFRLAKPGSDGVITTASGQTAKAPAKDNLPMWGEFSPWHDYSGSVDGKMVGIAIFADPNNPYPSAWHTRAYGLMAANPFGRKESGFPAVKGKSDLVKLAKEEHLKLRYGIYIHPGNATEGQVAAAYAEFIK